MAEKSSMPLLALVAVVVVVAVVVLVLNVRPSSEEAVAGEASRGGSEVVTLERLYSATVVEGPRDGLNACRTICQKNGGKTCIGAEAANWYVDINDPLGSEISAEVPLWETVQCNGLPSKPTLMRCLCY